MNNTKYYQRNKEGLLNKAKDYYQNLPEEKKQKLREKKRKKHRNLSEEQNQKLREQKKINIETYLKNRSKN